jgi:hypothetical protein
VHLDRSYKAIATSTDGLNDLLGSPIITHGFARHHNAVVECRITDKLVWPHALQEFLLQDDSVAVQKKVSKGIENPGLNLKRAPLAAQFVKMGVEFTITKDINHRLIPPPTPLPHGV